MRMRGPAGGFLTVLMLIGAAACAQSAVSSGQVLDVTFEIDNNLPNIAGVSAYVVTETGSRRSLGPIESNQRGTFNRSLRAGTYYLLAGRVGADDIASERFRLDTDSITVMWNLSANQIVFVGQ